MDRFVVFTPELGTPLYCEDCFADNKSDAFMCKKCGSVWLGPIWWIKEEWITT